MGDVDVGGGDGRGVEGEGGAEAVGGGGRGRGGERLALELHPDLEEVERVGRATSHDGGNTTFDESLDTHNATRQELPRKVSTFES